MGFGGVQNDFRWIRWFFCGWWINTNLTNTTGSWPEQGGYCSTIRVAYRGFLPPRIKRVLEMEIPAVLGNDGNPPISVGQVVQSEVWPSVQVEIHLFTGWKGAGPQHLGRLGFISGPGHWSRSSFLCILRLAIGKHPGWPNRRHGFLWTEPSKHRKRAWDTSSAIIISYSIDHKVYVCSTDIDVYMYTLIYNVILLFLLVAF